MARWLIPTASTGPAVSGRRFCASLPASLSWSVAVSEGIRLPDWKTARCCGDGKILLVRRDLHLRPHRRDDLNARRRLRPPRHRSGRGNHHHHRQRSSGPRRRPSRKAQEVGSAYFVRLRPPAMAAFIVTPRRCRPRDYRSPLRTPSQLVCAVRPAIDRLHLRTAVALADREIDFAQLVAGETFNTLPCQATADLPGVPVLAGPVEATALGNVLVEARALGVFGSYASLTGLRALVAVAFARGDRNRVPQTPGGSVGPTPNVVRPTGPRLSSNANSVLRGVRRVTMSGENGDLSNVFVEQALAVIEKGHQLAGHFPSEAMMDRARRVLDGRLSAADAEAEMNDALARIVSRERA